MEACPVTPVKAIYRDANGLVLTDHSLCVKCQLCVEACPYGARWKHPVSQVPQNCMGPGCRALVAAGGAPACVQVCPTKARAFGDLRDPRSSVAQRAQAKGVRRITYDQGTLPHLLLVRS
jgi:Fe-S-cluster-containing dehydrogenase component